MNAPPRPSPRMRLLRGALRAAGLIGALSLLALAYSMVEPVHARGDWSLRWPWESGAYAPGVRRVCDDACVGTLGVEWVLGAVLLAAAGVLGLAGRLLRRRDLLHAASLGGLLGVVPFLLAALAQAHREPLARGDLPLAFLLALASCGLPALGLWLAGRTFAPGTDRRSLPRRWRDRLARVDLKRAWDELPEE